MTLAESRQPGLGALFDLTFSSFITASIIRIVYIVGLVLIGLWWLAVVIASFANSIVMGLVALIVVTIAAFLWILFLRIWLEIIMVIFRIAENTSIIAQATGNVPTGGFPVTAVATPARPTPPQT
jgi:hypothetical protein